MQPQYHKTRNEASGKNCFGLVWADVTPKFVTVSCWPESQPVLVMKIKKKQNRNKRNSKLSFRHVTVLSTSTPIWCDCLVESQPCSTRFTLMPLVVTHLLLTFYYKKNNTHLHYSNVVNISFTHWSPFSSSCVAKFEKTWIIEPKLHLLEGFQDYFKKFNIILVKCNNYSV